MTESSTLATAYDRVGDLVGEHWGDDLHYGYWDEPDDDFRAATARLTREVVARLGTGPGQRVLDVGCGCGGPAVEIAATTGAEVVGVDVNPGALEVARHRARDAGVEHLVEFVLDDVLRASWPEPFDAVVAVESTPHFDLDALYPVLWRLSRPGGRLVVETPCTRRPLDAAARRRAAGFLDLLRAARIHRVDEHLTALRDAGFEPAEVEDITSNVRPSFSRLARVLAARRDDLTRRVGRVEADRVIALFTDWASVTEVGGAVLTAHRR
ncbi:SAM-dependent methyltransferase [Saccharothrix obliqua]|uniref:SAM-dependent methyltransferase n=1 Tax=Saccharothrix obliqua TaxID=2861747 RepID=UPI001C5CDC6C|nr:methyltransferase domain-containing protein [Saccharothrix obliqua]MBW4717836.1 methyltransferase domain-containing protein [Saccharothrix obliqua]